MSDRHSGVTTASRQECGIREILNRIGDKWSVLVTVELQRRGPRRFRELLRAVDGISQRMLTLTLRRLERDSLVVRTVLPTSPPQVEYALTPMGEDLTVVLQQLADWSEMHRESIDRSRQEWDRRASAM